MTQILKHGDGYLLKPLQASPKKEREENFYRRVFSQSDDPDFLTLRKFIPNFYGVHVEHVNGQEQRYLQLEDLTEGFHQPCIMDVKVGARTWGPDASQWKQSIEE
ncbi:unnamed protein product, partial [Darwinula stevensoni]